MYRSGEQYLSGIIRYQRLRDDLPPVSAEVLEARTLASRSCQRDQGEDEHKAPITADDLYALREHAVSAYYMFVFHIMIVQFFFLMRMAEALALAPAHIEFRHVRRKDLPKRYRRLCAADPSCANPKDCPSVHVWVSNSKTDIKSRKLRRVLYCTCPQGIAPEERHPRFRNVFLAVLCPVHALIWLLSNNQSSDDESPFTWAYASFLTASRYAKVLATLIKAVGLTESYGTHSLRRGGAQALCLAGWSLQDIQLFGRWASLVIELYLLEAPMLRAGASLSLSMIRRLRGRSINESGAAGAHGDHLPLHVVNGALLRVFFEQAPPQFGLEEPSGWLQGIVCMVSPASDAVPSGTTFWACSPPFTASEASQKRLVLIEFDGLFVCVGLSDVPYLAIRES